MDDPCIGYSFRCLSAQHPVTGTRYAAAELTPRAKRGRRGGRKKDAVLSPMASTAPTQRDQYLLAIENEGWFGWKRTSGYYDKSQAEKAFSRYKRTFGGGLQAKREESQTREAS